MRIPRSIRKSVYRSVTESRNPPNSVERREIPVDEWLRGGVTASVTVDASSPVTKVEIDPERDFPDIDRSDNVWTAP